MDIEIPKGQLRYWDETTHSFTTPGGNYEFMVGTSSSDNRFKGSLNLR